MVWIFKNKKHEFDSYLTALVLAKSTLLLRFINEHPAGKDYARKVIMKEKYGISKLPPILRGFFIRALHNIDDYIASTEMYMTERRDVASCYQIEHLSAPYGNIQLRHGSEIKMDDGKYHLVEGHAFSLMFMSVFRAINIQQTAKSIIDFNVKSREAIEKYTKDYSRQYP